MFIYGTILTFLTHYVMPDFLVNLNSKLSCIDHVIWQHLQYMNSMDEFCLLKIHSKTDDEKKEQPKIILFD